MNRWLVFDRPTANAAEHPDREIELRPDVSIADAINEAIHQNRPIVLVVPAGSEQATVARVTPPGTSHS